MVATSLMLVLGAFAPVHSQELFLDNKAGSCQVSSSKCCWYDSNGEESDKDTIETGADGRCDCAGNGHKCEGKENCHGSDCNAICKSLSGTCGGWAECSEGCYFKYPKGWTFEPKELSVHDKVQSAEGWYKSHRSYNGDATTGYDEQTSSWNGDDYQGRCDCGDAGHVCGKGSSQGSCSSVSDCEDICDAVGDCQGFYLFPPGSGLNTADGGGCYFKKFAHKVSAEEELTLDNTASAEVMSCPQYDMYGGHWTKDNLDDHDGRCDCGEPGHVCEAGGHRCEGGDGSTVSDCSQVCQGLGSSECIGFAYCSGSGCYFKRP